MSFKTITSSYLEKINEELEINDLEGEDIVFEDGKEDFTRLFTVERGEDDLTFLCGWVDRDGETVHLNFDLMPKSEKKYLEKIEKSTMTR